ncbi:MAG TPA: hypothetical protein VLF94_00440 [Chlamydiales bacterium]|nr:hypothetical protein [Chlamydiales bacterium]
MSSVAGRLTRTACYLAIASARSECKILNPIVNRALGAAAREVGGTAIPQHVREKIFTTVGPPLKSLLEERYDNNVLNAYRWAYSSLTEEQLNEVAASPLAGRTFSAAHRAFHKQEDDSVLAKQREAVEECIQLATERINQAEVKAQIIQIVTDQL